MKKLKLTIIVEPRVFPDSLESWGARIEEASFGTVGDTKEEALSNLISRLKAYGWEVIELE